MANWWDDLQDSSQGGTATVEPPAASPPAPAGNWWDSLSDSSQQAAPIDSSPPTEAVPAPAQSVAKPAQPDANEYYTRLLQQNEAQKNQLRSQGVPEESLSSTIAQQNLQQGAADAAANAPQNAFTSFEQSFPVRTAVGAVQGVGETIAGSLLTGLGEVTGSNNFRDAAQHVYDVGRSREATNNYENAGSSVKNAIQQGVDFIAQSAPGAAMGLGGMAAYFGGTTAAKQLSEARERGESTADAYKQAATHGTIDAVWTLLGGQLSSGVAKLAGAESGVIGNAIGKLAEKLPLPSWSKVVGSVAEGTAGQVAQGVGMGASHYLGDVALGQRQFDKNDFIQSMESTIAPSIIAGAGGAAIHGFIEKIAGTIGQRVEALPEAVEQATKEQPQKQEPSDQQWSNAEAELKDKLAGVQPSGNPVDDGFNAGQVVSDVAQKHGVGIKDLADRVLAPQTAAETPLPAKTSTGLTELGGDLASGVADGWYESVRKSIADTGNVPKPEQRSNVGKLWEYAKAQGVSGDDFVDAIKESQPNTPGDYQSLAQKLTQQPKDLSNVETLPPPNIPSKPVAEMNRRELLDAAKESGIEKPNSLDSTTLRRKLKESQPTAEAPPPPAVEQSTPQRPEPPSPVAPPPTIQQPPPVEQPSQRAEPPADSGSLPDRPKGSALQEELRAKNVAAREFDEQAGYGGRKSKPTDQSAREGEAWLNNSIMRRPEWTGNDPARIADWLRGGFGDSYYWKFLKESGQSLEDFAASKTQPQPPTAAVSQSPDETPPQQPAIESSPSSPAASNTSDLSHPEDMGKGTLEGQKGLFEKPDDTRAARDAFDAQLNRVSDLLKTKLFSNPFDPELAKEFATLAYRAIKAGTLEFRDFVSQLTAKLGDSVMGKVGPHLRSLWDEAMDRHKSDLADKSPTSIKNATVDKERESHGLPPAMEPLRRSFGEVWDKAMAELDRSPRASDELINELRNKPRSLTDREDALLLHRQVELQNEFDSASQQLLDADDDATKAEARTRVAALSDSLLDIYNIGKQSGTETARGLNARKLLVNDDFSLAKMVRDKRVANDGRELTPEEHDKIVELQKKLAATQKAFDDYKQNHRERQQGKGIDELITDAKKSNRGSKSKAVDEGAKNAAIAKIRQGIADGNPLSDYGSFIQRLARYFVGQGISEREPLVDAVHGVLKDIIPTLDRRETMDAISGYGEYRELPKDAVSTKLRDLKGQMQQAAKLADMLEKGQAPLKTGMERRVPTDEERRLIKEVNETKKRLNIQPTDPATQLKSSLDAVKTRLKNQITDLEHQIGTGEKIVKLKSSVPRDQEAAALETKRDELKKQFDEIFGKPEMTDEQRLRLATKAVEKSIADIEARIKSGDVFQGKRESKTPKAPELMAARARRDALREQLKEMQLLPEHEAKRNELALQSFKARTTNRIADYQERIARGDYATKQRKQIPLDTEAFDLQNKAERLRDEWRKGILRDRLRQRTLPEKTKDTWLRWRRAFLLSSPITLAKLTSAAAEKVAFTPLEEAVGAGYSTVFPRLAAKAPREGYASVRAESKALTDGVVKGMQDSWKLLRTGHSDLDVTYGHDSGMPSYASDFFGRVHGSLKSVAKRGEFARAFQKRAEAAISEGLDVHDPIVQTRLGIESYKDANRSIFMQDNAVTDAYKWGMARFKQVDKATGKLPITSQVAQAVAGTFLPIVQVPTNVVAETMVHAIGTASGSARLARAYRNGIENLHPQEADLIMRHLKKGSLGMAMMTLGYFGSGSVGGYYQPGKRDDKDVGFGKIRIFGYDVPSYLIHNPLLECLQIGATIRRVAESRLKKSDTENQGLAAGVGAAAFGLIEEVPFVKEQVETAKLLNPYQRQEALGREAGSMLVPQIVSWTARQGDTNAQGEKIKRKPETVLQGIEQEVPGLRQSVPEAGGKKPSARLMTKPARLKSPFAKR